jgi:hypothetical protein
MTSDHNKKTIEKVGNLEFFMDSFHSFIPLGRNFNDAFFLFDPLSIRRLVDGPFNSNVVCTVYSEK